MHRHPFVEKVKTDIDRFGLAKASDKIIVGLSGGADSVALLSALHTLGYSCFAAHCNFHLRGDESDRDERHASAICKQMGVELFVGHFDVPGYIASRSNPLSVEMACRNLRYEWFDTLSAESGAQAVAVAHNADDNIETLMMNLARGTGIAGLRGMLPRNDRNVIRPMLHCSRAEIEHYLSDVNIDFIVDSTNLECDFGRNKMRNRVLPRLYEQFPEAPHGIMSTIDILARTESFYRSAIETLRKRYVDSSGAIDIRSLCHNEPHSRLLLFEWLRDKGFTSVQTDSIIDNKEQSGCKYLVGDSCYYLDRGKLRRYTYKTSVFDIADLYKIDRHDISEFAPEGDRWTIYVDGGAFDSHILSVRNWKTGDRIKPFGMRGTKKISDIYSDAKIPLAQKNHIPLLLLGDDIIWVTGLRASRLYAVRPDSKSYVSIHYVGPQLF